MIISTSASLDEGYDYKPVASMMDFDMETLEKIRSYSSAVLSVPTKTSLPSLFWLHIEKTGTSIGMTFYIYACPRVIEGLENGLAAKSAPWEGKSNYTCSKLERVPGACTSKIIRGHGQDFGWHLSYNNPKVMNGTVVTMFRHPTSRLLSAFLFDKDGMIPPGYARDKFGELPRGWVRDRDLAIIKKKIRESEHPVKTYADTPGISSCMTKQVLGQTCGARIHLTQADLEEAKHRVAVDFVFVGLTEEYSASVSLFHAQFGDNVPGASKYERMKYRVNSQHTPKRNKLLKQELLSLGYKDYFDEELYAWAAAIFYHRCKMFNIRTRINIDSF